ncbi:MAG: M50 family metallopeptidase [Solirubrobacterales bacterium]
MSWVLTVAGFAALVILHEAGHFAAAKATGMRVERFFLFFPPKLVSVKRGETEYGIGALPLGGFVKITGMNPDEELPAEVAPRAYYHQPVWKRIVVISAGPAMNLLIAFVILFALAFGLRNIDSRVGQIDPGSPASMHLQAGDRIVAVDGKSLPNASADSRLVHFSHLVGLHKCPGAQTDGCKAKTPVKLEIERGGHIRTLSITPVYDPNVHRTRLGFSYGSVAAGRSAPGAAAWAAGQMWRVTTGTIGVFGKIFQAQERKKIHGIVGISDVTHQAFEFGVREALGLIALISLSLAIINLFPFLPLDGGHIFWSLVEKVRGRPVPFRVMERASAVGFLLVMILFAVGLSNDLRTLTNGGFNTR